jgi:hypothetical protein
MPRSTWAFLAIVVWIGVAAGCTKNGEMQEYQQAPPSQTDPHAGHSHEHAHGPHDGHLIELGAEQFHAELVFDPESRVTTIYLLGSDAETAHATEAAEIELHLEVDGSEVELTLAAAPQEGDPEGKSSRFQLPAEQLPEAIKDEEGFHGHVTIVVDGQEFKGEITHDHEHGEPEMEKEPGDGAAPEGEQATEGGGEFRDAIYKVTG